MGAWIEIESSRHIPAKIPLSLPVWERGLKFIAILAKDGVVASLPVWERGLKYKIQLVLTET